MRILSTSLRKLDSFFFLKYGLGSDCRVKFQTNTSEVYFEEVTFQKPLIEFWKAILLIVKLILFFLFVLKGILRQNFEGFLKKRIYEKLGISEMK